MASQESTAARAEAGNHETPPAAHTPGPLLVRFPWAILRHAWVLLAIGAMMQLACDRRTENAAARTGTVERPAGAEAKIVSASTRAKQWAEAQGWKIGELAEHGIALIGRSSAIANSDADPRWRKHTLDRAELDARVLLVRCLGQTTMTLGDGEETMMDVHAGPTTIAGASIVHVELADVPGGGYEIAVVLHCGSPRPAIRLEGEIGNWIQGLEVANLRNLVGTRLIRDMRGRRLAVAFGQGTDSSANAAREAALADAQKALRRFAGETIEVDLLFDDLSMDREVTITDIRPLSTPVNVMRTWQHDSPGGIVTIGIVAMVEEAEIFEEASTPN